MVNSQQSIGLLRAPSVDSGRENDIFVGALFDALADLEEPFVSHSVTV